MVGWRINFSSDAIAKIEGLLAVNRDFCKQQMAEKAFVRWLPVSYTHLDVYKRQEQIAPEVVGHGLVGMLREVVRVERVVRGTNEMHRHGFIIFLFVRQRAGAEHHERHQQRYDGEEFLHREASFAIVEPNSYRFY